MATVRDSGIRRRPGLARPSKRAISLALIVVGAGLLGYVAGQYWFMYHAQRVLEVEWARQAAAPPVAAPAASALTRISIPKIGLDAIVLEGASRKQLSRGPAHLTDTALPGEPGNSVITGHRDTFFRHIFELDKGDEIDVQRSGRLFRYQVTAKKVVQRDDVGVLRPSGGAELTLITCYPIYYIGPAPKRLVVFSRLVADSSNPSARLLQ